jgi:hypothetical protein
MNRKSRDVQRNSSGCACFICLADFHCTWRFFLLVVQGLDDGVEGVGCPARGSYELGIWRGVWKRFGVVELEVMGVEA